MTSLEKSQKILEIRQKTGLSQAQLADKFGIPKHSLINWERNRREVPDYVLNMMITILQYEGLIKN